MDIDRCLKEVAKEIKMFLAQEGGYENGYYTWVSGEVTQDAKGCLKWSTPKAKDELTEKGLSIRGERLYGEIQKIMKDNGVDKLLIRSRDVEFGSMETVVVHVTETNYRVSLY